MVFPETPTPAAIAAAEESARQALTQLYQNPAIRLLEEVGPRGNDLDIISPPVNKNAPLCFARFLRRHDFRTVPCAKVPNISG